MENFSDPLREAEVVAQFIDPNIFYICWFIVCLILIFFFHDSPHFNHIRHLIHARRAYKDPNIV